MEKLPDSIYPNILTGLVPRDIARFHSCSKTLWNNLKGQKATWRLVCQSVWLEGYGAHVQRMQSQNRAVDSRAYFYSVAKPAALTARRYRFISPASVIPTVRDRFLGNLDSQFLVSGGSGGEVRLWNIHRGCLAVLRGHAKQPTSLAVIDRNTCVTASKDRSLIIWAPRSLQQRGQLVGHRKGVHLVKYLGNGNVVSAAKDLKIKVWNLPGMICTDTLAGHRSKITEVLCLGTAGRIVSASRDKTIRIWKLSDHGRWVSHQTLLGHTGSVNQLLENNGRIVSGSSDGSMRQWNLETGACERSFHSHTGPITALKMRFDRSMMITTSKDGTVRLWSNTHLGRVLERHPSAVFDAHLLNPYGNMIAASVSADGDGVSAGGLRMQNSAIGLVTAEPSGLIRRLHPLNNDCVVTIAHNSFGWYHRYAKTADALQRVANSGFLELSDLNSLCSVSKAVYRSPKPRLLESPKAPKSRKAKLEWVTRGDAYNPVVMRGLGNYNFGHHPVQRNYRVIDLLDPTSLLIGWDFGMIGIFNYVTQKPKGTGALYGHEGAVTALLALDSRYAVSGSDDCNLRYWDTLSGTCLAVLRGHTLPIKKIIQRDATTILSVAGRGEFCEWVVDRNALDTFHMKPRNTWQSRWNGEAVYVDMAHTSAGDVVVSRLNDCCRLEAVYSYDPEYTELAYTARSDATDFTCITCDTGDNTPTLYNSPNRPQPYFVTGSRFGSLLIWSGLHDHEESRVSSRSIKELKPFSQRVGENHTQLTSGAVIGIDEEGVIFIVKTRPVVEFLYDIPTNGPIITVFPVYNNRFSWLVGDEEGHELRTMQFVPTLASVASLVKRFLSGADRHRLAMTAKRMRSLLAG